MSNKTKINSATNRQEAFKRSCQYIGMKLLAEQYQDFVEKAGQDNPGYQAFISDIVQAEAAAKRQRHVEYLVKKSKRCGCIQFT